SYLDVTWDDEGTALLPLFLSCRAAIRAKVVGFAASSEDQPQARNAALEEARDYLERALGFLAPPPARLIAIGGVSGTGKSTLAAALAPEIGAAPGAVVLRSDVLRKKLFGKAPEERLDAVAYRKEVTQRVYGTLVARAATLLGAGHAAIVDAVFLRPDERAAVERAASDAGAPFQGLWLSAPAGVLERRIADRRGDASDATPVVLRRQLSADPGPIAWSRLDASGSPEAMLDAARTSRPTARGSSRSGRRAARSPCASD
ncbi:MAG: AAA family ATPase, partial [Geminicoccales bacterium]